MSESMLQMFYTNSDKLGQTFIPRPDVGLSYNLDYRAYLDLGRLN
jgi:hypothetical protein